MVHDHGSVHRFMMMTERLELETRGEAEMIDITGQVARLIVNSNLKDGQVLLFCVGSTGGLTTIEMNQV